MVDWTHDTRPRRDAAWVFPPLTPSLPRSLIRRSTLRYLCGTAALLIGAFIVLIAATRPPIQPNTTLREALFPHNCAAPCFIGVRPGQTSLADAAAILRAHPWVKDVRIEGDVNRTFLRWSWTGEPSAALNTESVGLRPFMSASRDVIQLIYLPTHIPYGDVWNWLGAPERAGIALTGRQSSYSPDGSWRFVDHAATYFDGRIEAATLTACPFDVESFWRSPVIFLYSAPRTPRPDLRDHAQPVWLTHQPC